MLCTKWTKDSPITIHIKHDDLVLSRQQNFDPITVDSRGYIRFGHQIRDKYILMNHSVTVILGAPIPRGSTIYVPEESEVFTSYVTTMGQVAKIGNEYMGKPVTIIIHNVTDKEFEQLLIAKHNLT
jgi:putative transposon-encoded protein